MKKIVFIMLMVFCGTAASLGFCGEIFHCGFEEKKNGSIETGGYYSYVEGVSGKGLEFDGYTTKVAVKVGDNIDLAKGFTIEAWVAPQVYPWNWCGIVERQQGKKKGFSLGIEARGYVGLKAAIGGKFVKCVSREKLELLKWSYLVGVYDPVSGLKVYINGKKVCSSETKGTFSASKGSVLIGRAGRRNYPRYSERDQSKKILSNMVWDGLIDEVGMHDVVLSDVQIKEKFEKNKPVTMTALKRRVLPSGPAGQAKRFGAYYCRLNYAKSWDRLWRIGDNPDILVMFDESPVRLVFWHGTNYGACWVTENGKWMADQSLETDSVYGDCAEHMGDKRCEMSNVRLLESNDARIVIHWRYALSDIRGVVANANDDTGWGDWADEYYYIYPDAIGVRKQTLWTTRFNKPWHQYQETIFFNQPGTRPEDNVEIEALTLANMQGQSKTYSWAKGTPKAYPEPTNANIQITNMKSLYRPFLIFEPGGVIGPFPYRANKELSNFPWWNHWPVAQIANDGRCATGPDRPSHSSITISTPVIRRKTGANPNLVSSYTFKKKTAPLIGEGIDYSVLQLCGMTRGKVDDLLVLARSWVRPAELKISSDAFRSEGYNIDERAYHLEKKQEKSDTLEITLNASMANPIVNPAFVIKNWGQADAILKINGNSINRGKNFRFGHRHRIDTTDLVMWVKTESVKPVEIVISSVGE